MENFELDDARMASYAAAMAKKDAERQANAGSGSYQKEYEEVHYMRLETGKFGVCRILGAPVDYPDPNYQRKPYDFKEVVLCEIKGEDGKKYTLKLPVPSRNKNENHIVHRLYAEVAKKANVNGKSVAVYEEKFPDLFEAVSKTGYKKEEGKSYQYNSGLKGDRVVIFNVIDRTDNWCKDNKHTKLICRDVQEDGVSWAKPGLKSFGFLPRFNTLVAKYKKSHTKFDVAIMKTGLKDNPFELRNASYFKEKDCIEELTNNDGSLVDVDSISVDVLSPEELAYTPYDLDKLFRPTAYRTINEKIGWIFKLADAKLGTHFTEELNALIEKEKEEYEAWKAEHANNSAAETAQAAAETAAVTEALATAQAEAANASFDDLDPMNQPAQPMPRREAAKTGDFSLLPHYEELADDDKALIEGVTAGEKYPTIQWKVCEETKGLYVCDCGLPTPKSFKSCPLCGTKF